MTDLTQGRLREVLQYDPATGDFTWLISMKGRRAGTKAKGVRPDGYQRIRVDGRLYYAHRLAFMWMYGRWPMKWVDHADGNPSNNKWSNLREATPSDNMVNRASRNRFRGVSRAKTGWRASIMKHRKFFHLGIFETEEEAHEAYRKAALALHGKFARAA